MGRMKDLEITLHGLIADELTVDEMLELADLLAQVGIPESLTGLARREAVDLRAMGLQLRNASSLSCLGA